MKLRPLMPIHRLANGMRTPSGRAGIRGALDLSPVIERSGALIVVGDGDPDNRALLALAAALNGQVTVDVAFPQKGELRKGSLKGESRLGR